LRNHAKEIVGKSGGGKAEIAILSGYFGNYDLKVGE